MAKALVVYKAGKTSNDCIRKGKRQPNIFSCGLLTENNDDTFKSECFLSPLRTYIIIWKGQLDLKAE